MKNKGLGIPYMGSKRKIAPKIVDYILAKNQIDIILINY